MVSMEREALEKISEEGGAAHIKTVADVMQISREYARLLCEALGRADYLDVDVGGMCRITPKGADSLATNS